MPKATAIGHRVVHGNICPTLETTLQLLPAPIELYRVADEGPTGRRLRDDPAYHRVRHGVYAPSAAWRDLKPWERYLARVHAYALRHPDAIFCLESAAVLCGLPVFGEPRDIHVFDPDRRGSQRIGDVLVHTGKVDRALARADHLQVVDITDTVLDLARMLPPAFGLSCVDTALGSAFGIERDTLRERAQELRSPRGTQRLKWVLDNADPASESPAETVSRAVILWWGLEIPELQVVFHYEGCEDRVDFYWRRLRLIGECDGEKKYSDSDPKKAKRQLLQEKEREDRLRRHEGGMTRWGWSVAMRGAPLRDRLALAGVPQVRPVQHAMLATLLTHPRSFPPGQRLQVERDRLADEGGRAAR
ncbi:hypothetical protein ET475_14030 [Microbacterium protaetiae]|uniref:Uncharacterized protein n=1 Tax=Microbacterium protaetiae TaxID=2509458 RepID=A0A4P6EGH0_9MICO|nr:hypothetical protein [Microbacterium protaetiae]QAY60996.1 hypothetical protein ET475_14030 [Microbacterium protaetiae]